VGGHDTIAEEESGDGRKERVIVTDRNGERRRTAPGGPILQEILESEYFADLRKLPAKYRKIRVFVTRDRDTGVESEVVVKWADQVLYKDSDTAGLARIKERVEAKRYRLIAGEKGLSMSFPEEPDYKGSEKRGRKDRRVREDRRK
jgi:hypothetical protein